MELKKMQLLSSAAFSLGHGGNDSQKSNGYYSAVVYINANPGNVNGRLVRCCITIRKWYI
jgi:phosphate/sulfate permease